MPDLLKIACVQADVRFGEPMHNADFVRAKLEELSGQGVKLAVFPEAFLTGYVVDSREQALGIAIERTDEPIWYLHRTAERFGIAAVVGFAERDKSLNLYNSAVLVEPGHEPRFYQKTHIPCMGLDQHVRAGDSLAVFDTAFGRIGVLICFDLRYPEATRTLALEGADLLVLPTNWPEGAEVSAESICIARAAENGIYVATCNRSGVENGFAFIGRSKIIGPGGNVISAAGAEPQDLVAEVDLSLSRQKRRVVIPGKYETEIIAARRPELYRPLTESPQ